jgi:hypothetical protein
MVLERLIFGTLEADNARNKSVIVDDARLARLLTGRGTRFD